MLLPHALLVLLFDGRRMRLPRNRGSEANPHLEQIDADELDNPRTHVLADHQPGRPFQSGAPSRHAYPAADLHTRREDEFGCSAPVLIAPRHMLGILRTSISSELEPRIVASSTRTSSTRIQPAVQTFLQAQEI